MLLVDPDLGVGSWTEFARHHECEDTRYAGFHAGAAPNVSGEILGREFDRWHRRNLADLFRDDLIDGRIGENVFRLRSLRPYSSQESGGAYGVISDLAAGMRPCEIGHHNQGILER